MLTANDLFSGDVKETTNSCNFCKKYNENGTNTVGKENWTPSTRLRKTKQLPVWEISGNSTPCGCLVGKGGSNNEEVVENSLRKMHLSSMKNCWQSLITMRLRSTLDLLLTSLKILRYVSSHNVYSRYSNSRCSRFVQLGWHQQLWMVQVPVATAILLRTVSEKCIFQVIRIVDNPWLTMRLWSTLDLLLTSLKILSLFPLTMFTQDIQTVGVSDLYHLGDINSSK